jgi:hypothetical protein
MPNPCERTVVVHILCSTGHEARLNIVQRYFCGVHDGEIDPTLVCLVVKHAFNFVSIATVRILGFLS